VPAQEVRLGVGGCGTRFGEQIATSTAVRFERRRRLSVGLVSATVLAGEALRRAIEADPALVVSCVLEASPSAVAALAGVVVNVVIVDGTSQEAILAISHIRALDESVPIVAYGVPPAPAALSLCACNGATLIASREASLSELVSLAKAAADGTLTGDAHINSVLLKELAASSGGTPIGANVLTPRERDVAGCLAEGLTNKEIAQRYCLSIATVKTHVHGVLRKLGVQRRHDVGGRLHWLGSDLDPNSIHSQSRDR
jgi:two-component system nitrate/nitrite response regulator NarL